MNFGFAFIYLFVHVYVRFDYLFINKCFLFLNFWIYIYVLFFYLIFFFFSNWQSCFILFYHHLFIMFNKSFDQVVVKHKLISTCLCEKIKAVNPCLSLNRDGGRGQGERLCATSVTECHLSVNNYLWGEQLLQPFRGWSLVNSGLMV